MHISHLIRKGITVAAVAAGMAAGSVLGAAPAHADAVSVGDCTITAKTNTYRPCENDKFRRVSIEGVGGVRCGTRKASISVRIVLLRNGDIVQQAAASWANSYGEQVRTGAFQEDVFSRCGEYQSVLSVDVSSVGRATVTSGAPVRVCS